MMPCPQPRPWWVILGLLTIPGLVAATPGPQEALWISRTLARMTLEEKVGQLFVSRARGVTANTADPAAVAQNRREAGVDNALALVRTYHVGGLIYFGDNITTPEALARFGNAVQAAAEEARVPIPILTTIDQEQGLVVRVGPPATQFPGSMALGASRQPGAARIAARITGRELAALGVFGDYAPVADVNINPANPVIGIRSFGARASLVARFVQAQVRGFRDVGMVSAAKHFPGHGDTSVDSHTGLPVITHDRQQLDSIDLPPFRSAIAAGVLSIMTAHIVVPALDPSGSPATLSRPIVTGLLRGEMHYDGVVVTDSLRMEAVRQTYGDDRVAVLAILAGVDQLLDPPDLKLAYNAVLSAVRSGEIPGTRLDASVARILRLKRQLGLIAAPYVDEQRVSRIVGRPRHLRVAQRISDATPTLIANRSRLLPARVRQRKVLVVGRSVAAPALASALSGRGAAVTLLETGLRPGVEQRQAALARSRGQDLIVVAIYNALQYVEQIPLVKDLLGTGVPVAIVATGTPYDIAAFPEAPTYLASYSFRGVAMASAIKIITGALPPRGKLPVSIPSLTAPEQILYPYGFGLRWR